MTLAAVLVIAALAAVAIHAHRRYRLEQRWRNERDRIEAYGERMAAHNGHPDGDVVAIVPQHPPTQ